MQYETRKKIKAKRQSRSPGKSLRDHVGLVAAGFAVPLGVLIDDRMTTGATLDACSRALRKA